MSNKLSSRRIALIGGGPTSLYVLQKLILSGRRDISVTIFERTERLGAGMPYSELGADPEHVTNISWKELPGWGKELKSWLKSRKVSQASGYGPQEVMPRLLLGGFMEQLFTRCLDSARQLFSIQVKLRTAVCDIVAQPSGFEVVTPRDSYHFDALFICTGHVWPADDLPKSFYRSPYPPGKLAGRRNHPVALRGSSLTAIDALRSLASRHGEFFRENDRLRYRLAPDCPEFRLVMHSRSGYLPCPRFYFKDEMGETDLIDWARWAELQEQNSGFLPLDEIYASGFKKLLKDMGSSVFPKIESKSLEEFVEMALDARGDEGPFEIFRREFEQARDSYETCRPILWKEAISLFSFVVSYAVKHFSAEDMLRYEKHLQPLAATVIAFVPPSSAEQLLALYDAGVLDLLNVEDESSVEPHPEQGAVYTFHSKDTHYKTFVDCVGQAHLSAREFPFPSLLKAGVVSPATSKFRNQEVGREFCEREPERALLDNDGEVFLKLAGVAINDLYQPLNSQGRPTAHLYILAVPLIGGHNPDFSGLDVADLASSIAVEEELGPPELEKKGPDRALRQMSPETGREQ